MATNAVGEVHDPLFLVLLVDLALVVLMAAVARVCRVASGVTGRTGPTRATMVQREGMGTIVRGRLPGAGRMA